MFAADVKNPWALAHGITAFGATFVAADGRKASDVMVHDFLLKNVAPDGGWGPGAHFGFLKYAADGTPIEPHSNLITKTLVRAGLPASTKLPASWGPVTVGQLVEEMKRGFRHVPSSEEYWKDSSWTLDALSTELDPQHATFKDGEGQDIDFNHVMDDALTELERGTADLKAGLAAKAESVPKRKQGIYAHPCGGMHFIQAILGWARFPEVQKRWGPRVQQQIDILFYRLDSERVQYDAALAAGGTEYRLQILTQMVKFYGHFLETTSRLRDDLKWSPNAAQLQAVQRAKALLDNTVRLLDADKAFSTMPEIKKKQPQVYLDLIGDACHAVHGWEDWDKK